MDDPPDRGYSRAPELRDLAALCRSLNREKVRYVDVPVASKRLFILMKDTVRDSDRADVAFLRARIEAEER